MKKEVADNINKPITLNNDYYTACISFYSLNGSELFDKHYLKISKACLKSCLTKMNKIAFDKYGITFGFSNSDIFALKLQGSYINGISRIELEAGSDLEPYKIKEEQENGDNLLFDLFDSLKIETRNKFGETSDWKFNIHKSERYIKKHNFRENNLSFFN